MSSLYVCSLADSKLTRAAFDSCIARLLPAQHPQQQLILSQLSNLFSMFDFTHGDFIYIKEIVTGLCFLCAATKEEKLSLAFHVLFYPFPISYYFSGRCWIKMEMEASAQRSCFASYSTCSLCWLLSLSVLLIVLL